MSESPVEVVRAGREAEREALHALHDEAFAKSDESPSFDPHSAIWGAATVLLLLRERSDDDALHATAAEHSHNRELIAENTRLRRLLRSEGLPDGYA